MAEVGGDGACSEVDVIAEDGVADVAEVANCAAVPYDGVFDFDSLADKAVVTDGGGAAEVAVGSDFAIFSNDDVAFDDDAGENPGSCPKVDDAIDVGGEADLAEVFGGFEWAYQLLVDVEELPGVADEK